MLTGPGAEPASPGAPLDEGLIERTIHVQHAGGAGILASMAETPAILCASVARLWSTRATPTGAGAHLAHFRSAVLPDLRRLVGAAARGVLADFDPRVEHFELALHAEP